MRKADQMVRRGVLVLLLPVRFVVFCFCNLIIVIILLGSRPVSKFDRESEILRSAVINAHARVKEDTLASHDGNEISIDDRKVSIILEEPTGEGGEDDEESGNDNEDDELRRRAEEFISKEFLKGAGPWLRNVTLLEFVAKLTVEKMEITVPLQFLYCLPMFWKLV
ncbi:hypothetical protein OIU76_022587 [Salix suchowensis]|nr:hypothetical protein OIU76_022587 [Salix suchowensis]